MSSANSAGLEPMHYWCCRAVSVSSLFSPYKCNGSSASHWMFVVIAACIDRWALCSQSAFIRSFSRPRMAVRVIVLLIVVWAIIPIHLAIFFSNVTGRCIAQAGTYAFTYAIYSVVVIGILPLLFMILFSALAWRNLQQIRSRVNPTGPARPNVLVHKRDRDLMKMLFFEVFVYCVTTVPYPINLIYNVSTNAMGIQKDSYRLAIESLIGYIITPLLNFMYCCVQFYGMINSDVSLIAVIVVFFSSVYLLIS